MTTPTHYLREQLKLLLGHNRYYLYHWTSLDSALNIIKDGFIFSKATLFGKYFHTNHQALKNIKKNDAIAESKNGFIDYVFLGNTNWANYSGKSFYGEICFVIKPEEILPNREFFVFPFNSGRNFSNTSDQDKTSDIRILLDAVEQNHPCYEVLVRRRIKISPKTIDKILCVSNLQSNINRCLTDKKLQIPTETLNGLNNMHEEDSIRLIDPADKNKNEVTLTSNQYVRKGEHIYVKTEYSNCILTLRIGEHNQLIDAYTNKTIGELIPAHALISPSR